MKKISHEVPLQLLELSRTFNDYDYALVHLFQKYPQYYKFFSKSLEMGRDVLLDNSIFELGQAFDMDKFAKWIVKLQPTKYVVPDVLEDTNGTIRNLDKWMVKYGDLPGKKIGVVQGKNYKEFKRCYKYLLKYCDEIAFSFNYSYYNKLVRSSDVNMNYMLGRQQLIYNLLDDGVINRYISHHLLGCSLPQEFRHYDNRTFSFIRTIDTSNPIVHGIKGIEYQLWGLDNKEQIKLADLIDSDVNPVQLSKIFFNVTMFRHFVNRDQRGNE